MATSQALPSAVHAAPDRLWPRWGAANAISEAIGLGLTLLLTGLVIGRLETIGGPARVLVAAVAPVLSGVIEATLRVPGD